MAKRDEVADRARRFEDRVEFAATHVPLDPRLLAPLHWPSWLSMAAFFLLSQLPHRALLALGRLLGAAGYRLAWRSRQRLSLQIAACYPRLSATGHQRLLRASFAAHGRGQVERLIAWWWPTPRLAGLLKSIEGLEHLRRLEREGQGCVLTTLHGTSMELVGALIRSRHRVDTVYDRLADPVYDWMRLRARRRHGTGIPLESAEVRSLVRHLSAGRCVWYAIDRDPGTDRRHVFAPFFGLEAATLPTISRYAGMTGARVLTLEAWHDADGGYHLRISPPLADFPGEDVATDCTRLNSWAEAAIRRHPEQYRWMHRRFRTRSAPGIATGAR